MTPRFFAFGCSFTAYVWPTWADLVGTRFPNSYYNYGRSGAGNSYIFNRFIQAHQVHKFTKDDLVIIQLTSTLREDRYLKGNWITKGSIQNFYPEDFINKYFDDRGYLIRDMASIVAMKTILDNIGCTYYFLALDTFNTKSRIKELYQNVLSRIKPSYQDILGKYYPRMIGNINNTNEHPMPGEHLQYINAVIPQLAPTDSEIANKLDNLIAKIWYTHNQGWDFYDWPIDRGFEKIEKDL